MSKDTIGTKKRYILHDLAAAADGANVLVVTTPDTDVLTLIDHSSVQIWVSTFSQAVKGNMYISQCQGNVYPY